MTSTALAVQAGLRDGQIGPRTAAHGTADPGDDRATAFLGQILAGDTTWRMSDVRRLMELHTLVAIGHWHADGLDETPSSDVR